MDLENVISTEYATLELIDKVLQNMDDKKCHFC